MMTIKQARAAIRRATTVWAGVVFFDGAVRHYVRIPKAEALRVIAPDAETADTGPLEVLCFERNGDVFIN